MNNTAEQPEPCNIVVFGASGDLTRRKLLPALARMQKWNLIAPESRIISVMRDPVWTPDHWRNHVYQSLQEFRPDALNDPGAWENFESMLDTHIGDLSDPAMYEGLCERFSGGVCGGNAIFYLAIPPEWYERVVSNLHDAGLLNEQLGFRRIVIGSRSAVISNQPGGSTKVSAAI